MKSISLKYCLRPPLLLAACACTLAPVAAPAQEWIWHGTKPGDRDVRFFRKEFRVNGAPDKATLTVSCDNRATVYLDGVRLGVTGEWSEPAVYDVAKALKAGDHLLAIRAENQGGAAGLLVRLEASGPDSASTRIVSDASWSVSDRGLEGWNRPGRNPDGFVAASSLGRHGVQPWGAVLAAAGSGRSRPNSAPRQATPAESLQVLEGFKVELLRSAQPEEGSWVSMTVDPQGRLIVSPQDKEPMLRFTLGNDGKIVKMETIDLPIRSAMGLLYAFDSLYVNGAGPEGYHLYRVRDTDGDDRYDKIELLRKWKGGPGEHGTHGIVLGPDRKLYIVNGNFVDVPDDILSTSPHRHYADDLALPRMEDGNGFGAGRKPPGGYVVRLDPDGKNAELFASGQRNTYDIAFNTDGELFGFDSDMEWDWGTPWYRPTRVFHLVSGADHGFREGTAKWPEYYPDSLPATVNIGIGSPTGVRFGTGAQFPAKYQRAAYVMDWSYGRIVAVHLQPDGASYTGTFENFVSGKPLNVTDLEIGKDGAMYFTIGGRRTQGGLYRVSHVGSADSRTPGDGAPRVTAGVGSPEESRALRRRLEAFHGGPDSRALDAAWPHLDSPDRFIRYAARIAVERQPVDQWAERALSETRQRAGLTALLALARYGDRDLQTRLLTALGRHPADELSEAEKLDALRVIEVCFARMGRPEEEVSVDVAKALDALYPSSSEAMNRELSQLLVYLDAPNVVRKTLDLRDAADTQEEQVHYMVTLRQARSGWTLDERRRYFAWFQSQPDGALKVAANAGSRRPLARRSNRHPETTVQWFRDVKRDYSDGASFNNFLKNLRKAALDALSETERREIEPQLAVAPAPAPGRPAPGKKEYQFVREWKLSDFLNDLDRAGQGRNLARGREAFAATQCLQCHRLGNDGGAVGPDLTAIASRFSRRDILESILEPSKVVSEQYQNITLTKKDGDDVTGRLVEETDAALFLIPDQLTGERVQVKRSDVAERRASKLSPMPEGLASILSKEEILDLLAYLEAGGKVN